MVPQILTVLYQHQIQSIIIEGGRQTLQSFIDQDFGMKHRIFIGTNNFQKGIEAPIIKKKNTIKTNILNDELLYITNHD